MAKKEYPTVYVHKIGYNDIINNGRAKITYTPTSEDNKPIASCFGITIGNVVRVRCAGGCTEIPLAEIKNVGQYKTEKGDVVHWFFAERVFNDSNTSQDILNLEDVDSKIKRDECVEPITPIIKDIASQLAQINETLKVLVKVWSGENKDN